MKTILCKVVLAAGLVLAGSSFAASQNYVGASDRLQPASAADPGIGSAVYSDRENLQILLQKLNDPDPFVRVEAVQALGEIQNEKALVSVCNCLNDENLYVRAYAAEALGKIGMVDISLTLASLIQALNDTSPYVRAMMAASLGELQDERASDSLSQLLQDEDERVRGMAAWALNKFKIAQ